MGRALAASRAGAPAAAPGERFVLGAVLAAEALLVAWAALGAGFAAAAATAAACVFLLVAFRAPGVAWAVTFLSVPLSMERTLPAGGAISVPSEPLILLALLGWGLRLLLTGPPRLRPSPMHAPLAALAIAALVSIAGSRFPVEGAKAWAVTAGYVAFGYLYLAASPCDPARRERWVRIVALTGAVWGLYGAIRVLLLGVSLGHAYGAARPFFTEHGTYGAYLGMLLPIPLFEALERRGRARLWFALAVLAIALGLALSFTRAAWVATAVSTPVALAIWAGSRRVWRALLLPVLLGLGIAIAIAGVGAGRNLARHAGTVVETTNVSNLERLNRWMAAWEMTKDRPWLGVGYGAYADTYPAYRRKAIVTEQSGVRFGVHSEPLRILCETGALGAACMLWFLAAAGACGVRAFRRATDPAAGRLALAVLAGLACYAVHGVFNSYLGIDKISAPFWLGLGALVALAPSPRQGAERDRAP